MKPDRHKQLATRRYWAKKRGGKGVTEDVAPKDDASGTGMGTAHGDSTRGRGRGYGRARGRGRGVDRSSTTAGLPSNAWRFGDEQTGADGIHGNSE